MSPVVQSAMEYGVRSARGYTRLGVGQGLLVPVRVARMRGSRTPTAPGATPARRSRTSHDCVCARPTRPDPSSAATTRRSRRGARSGLDRSPVMRDPRCSRSVRNANRVPAGPVIETSSSANIPVGKVIRDVVIAGDRPVGDALPVDNGTILVGPSSRRRLKGESSSHLGMRLGALGHDEAVIDEITVVALVVVDGPPRTRPTAPPRTAADRPNRETAPPDRAGRDERPAGSGPTTATVPR